MIMKVIVRLVKLLIILAALIFGIVFIVYIGPPIWHKWITYPRLEEERQELWNKYKRPPQIIPLQSYKGVIHSHTYWSHDSRGTLPEIINAAKLAKLEFIFNSDHKRNQLDTFPRGFYGVFDGVIMEAGTEHSSGLMISPFDSTVIDWSKPEAQIIREVVDNGGFAMYVHTEDEHDWENPDYQAMEIYNIHTDLLDEKGILPIVINSTINSTKYMHWAFRELYDDQNEIHAHWDRLNEKRPIVGIGAVDAHNNQSFRARYHSDGKVEWAGPNADTLVIREANWLDKLLLHEPDKYGWAFKWEMDPYFNSFNFVNNHVFCDTFSNVNIKDHILKGHVIVSFEHLSEAKGFQYYAADASNQLVGIVGASIPAVQVKSLKAVSPLPVRYQLIKDGELIYESEEEYEFKYQSDIKAGNYRIVASLWLANKWNHWIYTNPIYIY